MNDPLPTKNVAAYVIALAQKHGITYIQTDTDKLANAITRLADDDVVLDDIELLMLALDRAGFIPRGSAVALHSNYLHEKLGVKKLPD